MTERRAAASAIAYPRRRLARALVRGLGRLVLPLAFRLDIRGRERFPRRGPLLLAGNHTAAMEVALAVVYTPWPVEILGAADIPHEALTRVLASVYGIIPVHRGRFDRAALRQALAVLGQGGVVAIFPEGGIWDAGRMAAHTGVAWLSHRAAAPVLPVGFGGTQGALGAAARLRRPHLTMRVGRAIPPASLPAGAPRRESLEAYADGVVAAIRGLLPEDDAGRRPPLEAERFELRLALRGAGGEREAPLPAHAEALAELLHRPAVLKIFTSNLGLPTASLQALHREPATSAIVVALEAMLAYLEDENPYLLTYRFGARRGRAMARGLGELLALARRAQADGLQLLVTPIRRTRPAGGGPERVQVEQGVFEGWM